MTTRVIIVRHGQSSYNAQQKIQGRCDESVLTEQGQTEAKKVGMALQGVTFDAFYHSPLQRATQTASIIQQYLANSLTPEAKEELREVDLPLWEKLSKQEVVEKFPADYRCWKERPHEFKMLVSEPAGEKEHFPVLSLYEQAQLFWQEAIAKHQGQTILIVAHNGINRCLIMSAIGIPPERYHTIQQSNCCINVLNFSGGLADPVQLESLNQVSHMGIVLPPPRPPKPPAVRLLLVRHGETEWNRMSRFQGMMDIPLNETGKEQARKAAQYLKDVQIDFAVTSSLLRPKETAEIILEYHQSVPLALEDQFKEISHGLWEGKLESEIEAEFGELLQQWKDAPETVQMPEGENLQQVWDRAIAAWNKIVQTHSNPDEPKVILVSAHDAINKVIICYLLGLEPNSFWNIKQGNCAVSVIDYPQGAEGLPVLQTVNLTTYLGSGILDRTAAGAL
ncbi:MULTISPECIES: histidine phosphatase family protein [Spirulina sp. CCY15215]|uniref:histidine phosphatase family protein n=1 Tax=Spirulina sp. CCY15215 TaxID=2767591 RepID=UPI00195144F4|nr:histidine phosphatase family protein [Spirulina major]